MLKDLIRIEFELIFGHPMILLFLIQKRDKENLLIEVNLMSEMKSKKDKMRKVEEDKTV